MQIAQGDRNLSDKEFCFFLKKTSKKIEMHEKISPSNKIHDEYNLCITLE
jgi:hypothetical protein